MKILISFVILVSYAHAADCIAHRGVVGPAIENSLGSVLAAVELGADGVEFDIRHSKDGVPFLLHDSKLKRVADPLQSACSLRTKVSKLNWDEIRDNCRLKDGQELSSLAQVLYELRDYQGLLFIELKDKPSKKFAEVIEASGFDTSRIRFISFRLKFLQVVRDYFPIVESLRLSKFIPFLAWSRGMNVHYPLKPFTWLARLLGHENGVWVVDDEKRLRKYHRRKVDYITTDNLPLCLETKLAESVDRTSIGI